MRRLVAPFIAAVVVLAGVAWPSAAADFDATPHLLKDIAPGALNSETVRTGTNPDIDRRGVALGSKLIFGADTGTTYTLWVSDGTTHGTVPLATPVRTPSDFVVFANHVYFAADGPDGRELWKTDGTSAGTVEVANLNPASSGATDSDPSQLTVVGGSLYFVAKPAGSGQELYRLSAPPAIGPPAPPTKITSFGGSIGIQHLAAFGSKVVFSTDPGGTGFEPWISDGTAGAGHTFMLRDVYTGSTGSDPRYFTTVGSKVYFSAGSSASGVELWQSDGTSLGTTQVVDLIAGSTSGVPKDLYAYNGRLLFKQAAGTLALWTVDGSGVVQKLADLQGGGTDNNPTGWTYYGGYVYFSGSTPALGAELYRTRGVPGDVTLVKSINTGTSNSSPQEFQVVGNQLFFNAEDATHGAELWRSNGTAAGTSLVKDIDPGVPGSYPKVLGVLGGTLFVEAGDAAHGREPWVYTTRATTTTGYPKKSYKRSAARAKHLHLTVKVRAGGYVPTGTVVLKKGSKVIGSGKLVNGAVSIHITVKLPKGKTHVRAYYGGNVGASSSASAPITLRVK